MSWIVLCYSLPSQPSSSARVALWRRLRRLGALPAAGGAQILPAQPECVEAFQWLAQEIRTANGEALIMHVEEFAGLPDPEVVSLFCTARREEYLEIDAQAAELERGLVQPEASDVSDVRDAIARLRRRHADVARVDYFDSAFGKRVSARLDTIERRLTPSEPSTAPVARVTVAQYQDRQWVTRPRPYVDRLACVWLIRRFIDPRAAIRYAERPEPGEVAFDMDEAEFGHRGNLCTFETMQQAFGLDHPGLHPVAEVVHEIDLSDGRYERPETAGIEAILHGWRRAGLPDAELEAQGVALFEGLHAAFSGSLSPGAPVQGSDVSHQQDSDSSARPGLAPSSTAG